MSLCDESALTLSRMLRSGEISSRKLTESALKRIQERDPVLNAFITTTTEEALEASDQSDQRLRQGKAASPLDGIPVAVKDNICTRGVRTTSASAILRNYVPPYDATVIERLKRDGAVIVGKTNLDQFGMGSSTENSVFGATKNPHDPEFVPGGSSGGSAAAVAAGEAVLALGSDTGGSLRLPAAYCGVVGFKPTYGRVSRYGLMSYASSLDQIGALGRRVEDCAMLLGTLCGYDPRDSTSADVQVPDFLQSLDKGVRGLRIGLPEEYFIEGLAPGIRARIEGAVRILEGEGAEILEVSLPHTRYAISAYYLIAAAEASSNLARLDGVRYGYRSPSGSDLTEMYEATRGEGFSLEVKRRVMLGSYVLSAGYYEAYYLKAQKVRRLVKEDFDGVFEKVDCLLTPVSPSPPFRPGEKVDDPLQMYLVDVYTSPLNMSGLPGMSLPCGWVDGLPVGLQIIGRAFDEATILRVAHAYQEAGDVTAGPRH
ncbi:MAG: Asp-tRNA(Asn)/Glu-tRNA(Gln) amidotransferase subunit GatA [Thermodesulfobacteriota bacterium]